MKNKPKKGLFFLSLLKIESMRGVSLYLID